MGNAVIYAARGKWSDAGISLLGIIPYVGDLAKAGKLAKGVFRAAEKEIVQTATKSSEIIAESKAISKSGDATKTSTSLGAGRTGVKQWLQNAGNLERGQLIKDIEGAGFKKVFDGKGMMHFERGGMKIRLDPPQLPHTPYNHMHLNYGGKYGSYDINLMRVLFDSKAAHIPIR